MRVLKCSNRLGVCLLKNMFIAVTWLWLFTALTAGTATAHRVMIFAWIEGDRVFTQSKFPGGKKVSGGDITVMGQAGDIMLTGRTDAEGEFAFDLKQLAHPSALKIVLNAGMGHQAHWELSEKEVASALGDGGPPGVKSAAMTDAGHDPRSTGPKSAFADVDKTGGVISTDERPPCLTEAQIKAIVSETVDRKLSPMMDMLVAMQETMAVGIDDVVAGLGYILGLTGVGALVYARRRQ